MRGGGDPLTAPLERKAATDGGRHTCVAEQVHCAADAADSQEPAAQSRPIGEGNRLEDTTQPQSRIRGSGARALQATLRVVAVNMGRTPARGDKLDAALDVLTSMWPAWEAVFMSEMDAWFGSGEET